MRLTRTGLVLVGAACASEVLIIWHADAIVRDLRGPDFGAALVATVATAHLAACTALLGAVGRSVAGGGPPRVAALLLAAGIVAAAAPAHAGPLDGLRVPDQPVLTPPPPTRLVEVASGDTLWELAGRHTPQADRAHAVRAWHEANRQVIGDDPDLIHPGQHLVVPEVTP